MCAAQRTLAISEDARRDIIAEFGLPANEVTVTPLGVDLDRQSDDAEDECDLPPEVIPPARFFLSVATDFPHKNLRNLVEAHSILRRSWSFPGEPPLLVLVGSKASIRNGHYGQLSTESFDGVMYLGAVSNSQLLALYHFAEALVFPSVYEGFGLPILEAMVAGTPVIALPISSVPEVGGDAVLYPGGTSSVHLADAMERLVTDHSLRDELRERGLRQAARFRWEQTARLTLAAYRSAVVEPSERSLRARRQLHEVIAAWAAGRCDVPVPVMPGIRNAWKDLNQAVKVRVRREFGRLRSKPDRQSA